MSDLSQQLSDLAATWQVVETMVACPNGAVTQLLLADPLRWALWIGGPQQTAASWASLMFSTTPGPALNAGFVTGSAVPLIQINYRDWGLLAQAPWFVYNNSAAPVSIDVIAVRAQQ